MHMATYSSFVVIVGLWGGPYLSHVYGYGLTERGGLLLIPAVTQIVGLLDLRIGRPAVRLLQGAGADRRRPHRRIPGWLSPWSATLPPSGS